MPGDIDPTLLFPIVALLAAILAGILWRPNRGVAVIAASLAGVAALCVVNEIVARASRANIRVDLLASIPLVSVAALVVGLMTIRRPPAAARIPAAGLVLVGGVVFAWFGWRTVLSSVEGVRLTRTFDEGRKLYWEETIRCQDNFVRRFGVFERAAEPCRGNLVVTSRTAGSYPFSRVVLNDAGEVYLLFAPGNGPEQTWGLDSIDNDRPAVRLASAPGSSLSGDGTKDGQPMHIELRSLSADACEAKVVRGSHTDVLTLKKVLLAQCSAPVNPAVQFAGAWGATAPLPNAPRARRLAQIWFWQTGETSRGLLLSDLAETGTERPFLFARQLHGTRRAEKQWDMRVVNRAGAPESFTFTLDGVHARVAGSTILFGESGEMLLNATEIVSHPRIALTPVYDRDRFDRYFENVFFNFNLPWKVP